MDHEPARNPLAGRSRFVAEVDAARTPVCLVGPAGIGKSAVLDALAALAVGRGEAVLRLACARAEQGTPYQGFADLLRGLPGGVDAVGPTQRPVVRAVLAGRAKAVPRVVTACRIAWFDVVSTLAASGPVLVLVDDAQWLDPATADVLAYAARRVDSRVRFIVAESCTGTGAPADGVLPPPVAVFTVPALELTETAALLAGASAREVSRVHVASAGNPSVALAMASGEERAVPDLVSARLAHLTPETRYALLVCALAARPTVRTLLRAGLPDAGRDIAPAVRAGLVVVDQGVIRFVPPEVAGLLERSADARERLAVHRVLARAVTTEPEAVRHRLLAGSAENAAMVVAAAEAALRLDARGLAAELFLLAADRLPAARRAEALIRAAESAAQAGVPDILAHAAAEVFDTDADPSRRVRTRVALLRAPVGHGRGGDEMLAAALVDAAGDTGALALAHLWRAWSAVVAGDVARADAEAVATVDLARLRADTGIEARALAVRAFVLRLTGRADDTLLLEKGLALAGPDGDGERHRGPRYVAARFALSDDRLTEARAELLALLAAAERGTAAERAALLRVLAEVAVRQGRCRDALRHAAHAVRLVGETGLPPASAWYAAAVAELAGGDIDRAEVYARGGLRAAEQDEDVLALRDHLHVTGQIDLHRGDAHAAVRVLRRLRAVEDSHGIGDPTGLRWEADLVSALLSVGEPDEAEDVLAAARERATAGGAQACLDRADAVLLAARGRIGPAMDRITAAVAAFGELGQPIERGHSLLVAARIERRRRHYSAARAAAEAALLLFTGADALPWALRAEEKLALLSDVGDNGNTLTAAESRVAVMVGEGATNREIADQLYLSVKTVEATLTKVYRKLGVRSRIQLSSRLRADPGTAR